MSWYDLVLRLKLPDLLKIQQQKAPTLPESSTIIENLVMALMRESSIRNRQEMSVTLAGMANVHTPSANTTQQSHPAKLPPTLRPLDPMQTYAVDTSNAVQPTSPQHKHKNSTAGLSSQHSGPRARPHSASARYLPPRADRKSVDGGNLNGTNSNGMSMERYIPDDKRTRALQRQFLSVKQLLDESRNIQKSLDREMKRLAVSDLDRAKTQEALQTVHKVACGCCNMEFLPVNLPMKVSRKAILDIRQKWSGRLTSKTVFGGTEDVKATEEDDLQMLLAATDATKKVDARESSKKKQQQMQEEYAQKRQQAVPTCYDQVGVCVFCAQFFHTPEKYRPSYQQIVHEEKRAAYMEQKEREREYWDPLRMVEKDRERQEKFLADQQLREELLLKRQEEEALRMQEAAQHAQERETVQERQQRLRRELGSSTGSLSPNKTTKGATASKAVVGGGGGGGGNGGGGGSVASSVKAS